MAEEAGSHQREEDEPPRVALLLLAQHAGVAAVLGTVARIPPPLLDRLREVVVFTSVDLAGQLEREARGTQAGANGKLSIRADARQYGYGGRRKIALEYALERGIDVVAWADASPDLPVEHLADLIRRALAPEAPIVIAARSRPGRPSCAGGLHNLLLGFRIGDYASGFRVMAREWLVRLPFQLDADDRRFDTELLIQARAAGASIVEAPVPAFAEAAPVDERFSIPLSLWTALDYRLHQLHVTRRGQYLVDADVRYVLKRSPHGSHRQILDAIAPGTRVLDLGCSQGLLAEPLLAKNVRVVGVDASDAGRVSGKLERYHQHDLETPLVLPEGRTFDYVVVSDVIEHIRNRARLLRSVRRNLKPDGRLLISTPNIALWFYRLSLLAGRFEYGPRGVLDETHVHLFTRATIRREVERAGFRVLREGVTALPFEVVFRSTGQSRALRLISSAYHALARLWPEMFAYQILLEAEVTTMHDPTEPGDDE